ncbi:uncharacterized protein LAESUDRAFT_468754 [Laetiporus sulphureus 93-53]|uniref:Uncharacterized protein n=1 Tax=Laetiporus sulphureus 93-53 TaxID=1314785 RepID=A0A165G974_9APHY|nr:uncharacterized protein LAESUDRAFT_468754 [Laetiporus sulphureus 93-53]KZT10010.1 hypothetical protein LAESUDRAFT_468754 [Laetiporus sulphureus 93-53]
MVFMRAGLYSHCSSSELQVLVTFFGSLPVLHRSRRRDKRTTYSLYVVHLSRRLLSLLVILSPSSSCRSSLPFVFCCCPSITCPELSGRPLLPLSLSYFQLSSYDARLSVRHNIRLFLLLSDV